MRKIDGEAKLFYRSNKRAFCVNGDWFYQTREGNRGPFDSQEAALRDAQQYQHEMTDIATADRAGETSPFGHVRIEPRLPGESA